MKGIKFILCLTMSAILVFTGCAEDPTLSENNDISGEGERTVVKMSFTASDMELRTRSGAELSKEKEQEIKSIAIFIFDKNTGNVVSQTIHENAGAHSSSGDGVLHPNGSDKIGIETITGNNREVYVIANYHSTFIDGLKGVSSISEMNSLIGNSLGNPLMREFGICKVGHVSVNIRKNTDVPVELKYMSAKVTVKVVNKCDEMFIVGWTADGLPLKSYLIERTPIESGPNYHDASDFRNKEDYYYEFSDQSFNFDSQPDIPGVGSAGSPMEYDATFYMSESRRGSKWADRAAPPDGWPNGDPTTPTTRKPYQLKAWYAPENSARIRVLGQIQKNGQSPKSFVINHYMGDNNINDYNVHRGTHYTYTITINGINSIDIDTNIEQFDISLGVRPPLNLTSCDAHFDSRPFILHTDAILDPEVEISAEVLNSVNSDIHPEWLNLSTFQMLSQHVRKNSDANIALWQQNGGDNTYVRPKFIPNKDVREKITGYIPPVTLGTEEYPYDDTELTYYLAQHRMCKRITKIPTRASDAQITAPIGIFLNVSEYVLNDVSDSYREAVIRFAIRKPGQTPQYTHYTVRQYPPYRFTAAPDGNGTLVVERTEEYEHFTHSIMPTNLQIGSGMQWGVYDVGATDTDNGYNNTLRGVYKSITGSSYYAGTNYLSSRYGSLDAGWDKANNAVIREGAGVDIPCTGAPYYNAPVAGYPNAYHNVYNTTAARYCHEKNQDVNGDGDIDESETVWYLPAAGEMQLFWTYNEVINLKPDYYWSSTQADFDNAYAFSMHEGPAAPHLVYNGVMQPLKKNFVSTIGPPRVRCVRKASGNPTPIQPIVSHRINGTTVLDCSSLSSDMYTTESKYNISLKNVSAVHRANSRVYKRFEIQRKDNTVVDYLSLYSGNGKCDESKGWRLPTQREMLLMLSVRNQLEAGVGFEPFSQSKYWTMTRDISLKYIVNFQTGFCESGNFFESTNQFGFRCVRELP